MNGTVTRLRKRGVEVELSAEAGPDVQGARFEVYRVVGGVETVLGVAVVRRHAGTMLRLNPEDPAGTLSAAVVGDLVRSVP